MIPDVPAAVLASVRSTSDRPIPHPRQEPTVTAPAPSPAGLSPLLDQLDEARERIAEWLFDTFFGNEAELPEGWLERKADALLAGPLAPLTAAIRAVAEASRLDDEADAFDSLTSDYRSQGLDEEARRCEERVNQYRAAAKDIRSALTAALTPGADTAGATA